MQLQNKTAIITGASSGIGKEIAKLFAKEGALVILTARNLDKLKEVQKEIENNRKRQQEISGIPVFMYNIYNFILK
ncbi:MAG: SDR family NAD(P)-dependent oxidoreductase [Bacteroidetes bacterium]|nr:SDR family NAD(P)-dependent oxidoreductase [Bacteroidota bacterium]